MKPPIKTAVKRSRDSVDYLLSKQARCVSLVSGIIPWWYCCFVYVYRLQVITFQSNHNNEDFDNFKTYIVSVDNRFWKK